MKSLLVRLAIVALAIPTAAYANYGRYRTTNDEPLVGQHVFDLQDNDIGQIGGFIRGYGSPGVIIYTNRWYGERRRVTQAENLGWRAKGGLLVWLSDGDVRRMKPYDPPYWPLPVW
jgi:hypothetical protein